VQPKSSSAHFLFVRGGTCLPQTSRLFFCSWFVNLSTTSGFFTWWSICLTYIQFCTGFFFFHLLSFVEQALIFASPTKKICYLLRAWTQSPRPRSHQTRLLPPVATWPCHLGCFLDVDLHPRQRLQGILRLEHGQLYHRIHQHPHLLLSLDRLDVVHAVTILAS
jgi:hypothetical protein